MIESDSRKEVIYSIDTTQESVICPFTQPKGERIGNALLAIMFILVPPILLLYLMLVSQ
jgi:hypothetical protein